MKSRDRHVAVALSRAPLILRALRTRNGSCCHQDFEPSHSWRAQAPKRFRWVQCGARECRIPGGGGEGAQMWLVRFHPVVTAPPPALFIIVWGWPLVGVVLAVAVVFGAQALTVVLDGEPTVGVADL